MFRAMSPSPSETTDENEWDPAAYNDSHSFVYEYGADVVDLLDPQSDDRILDLGCGTGQLTNRIADRGAEVTGIDTSEEMISKAEDRFPACTFVRGDAREFDLDTEFDAVFSNAMLHWIDERDQNDVLERVAAHLRPGGRFVAELGGTGNVQSIIDAVKAELNARGYEVEHPWHFPTAEEYAERLENQGFTVESIRVFDRPTQLDDGDEGLAAWLDMFGDSLFAPLSETETREVIDAVEDRLEPKLFRDGSWIADYRRLRFAAVRPADSE